MKTTLPPAESIPSPCHPIVGQSPLLRSAIEQSLRLARGHLPILVTGESGTGKELFARLIHDHGPHASGPFVAVNCGALSRELAESELFGHERGAFTGAGQRKQGWFEEASEGTLVLDEIGELPLDLQPKLLRVLETGRLRRVGGNGEVAVKLRVVALTLRDLRKDVSQGRFRTDLYYRLAGCELRLPALRERPTDIPVLAKHFLTEIAADLGPRTLSPFALTALQTHLWPGNVRELRHTLRRAALLADHTIEVDGLGLLPIPALPNTYAREPGAYAADAGFPDSAPPFPVLSDRDVLSLRGKTFSQLQADIFRWALLRSGGSRRRAAASLGMSRSTFCDRVRRMPGIGPGRPGYQAIGCDIP